MDSNAYNAISLSAKEKGRAVGPLATKFRTVQLLALGDSPMLDLKFLNYNYSFAFKQESLLRPLPSIIINGPISSNFYPTVSLCHAPYQH